MAAAELHRQGGVRAGKQCDSSECAHTSLQGEVAGPRHVQEQRQSERQRRGTRARFGTAAATEAARRAPFPAPARCAKTRQRCAAAARSPAQPSAWEARQRLAQRSGSPRARAASHERGPRTLPRVHPAAQRAEQRGESGCKPPLVLLAEQPVPWQAAQAAGHEQNVRRPAAAAQEVAL